MAEQYIRSAGEKSSPRKSPTPDTSAPSHPRLILRLNFSHLFLIGAIGPTGILRRSNEQRSGESAENRDPERRLQPLRRAAGRRRRHEICHLRPLRREAGG